jgi:predicted DCC family thiol-disulfide oxidoreductase YuxK
MDGMETPRPTLIFDGDCAFCTSCVGVVERRIRPDAEVTAWQFADLAALGISEARASDALQWVEPDGVVLSGHRAVAATLLSAGPGWRLAGRALLLPGISWLAARAYRLIADNRHRLPGGTPACQRSQAGAPGP